MVAAAVPTPFEVPGDVRLMHIAARAIAVAAALMLAATASLWIAGLPVFALRSIRLEGDLTRNSVHTLRANAASRLAGNFFSLDLQRARQAFESVPWVRRAVVSRVWPNRLTVRLEEHRPVALWGTDDGNDRLVNSFGEVFEANIGDVEDDALPRLAGPDGSAARVLAMLRRLEPVLAQLQAGDVEFLGLSARGSWRVGLDRGAKIELGRGSDDEVMARVGTFVRTLPQVSARFQRALESADLRHADGYAVRLRGVTTQVPVPAARKR